MKTLKYILLSIVVGSLTISCDILSSEPDLPIPLDETMSNTGGFIRVLSVTSSAFDVFVLESAKYEFIAEISDVNQGNDAESVTFYATYVTIDENGRPVSSEEVEIPDATVDVSSLDVSETTELPTGTFVVTLQQILNQYDGVISKDDLKVGDRFDIRWQLNMKDGRSFTNNSVSQSVTGGFYSSPFFARAGVVVGVPSEKFVGDYEITQVERAGEGTVSAAYNSGWLFNGQQTNTITLSVTSIIGRGFSLAPWVEYGIEPLDYVINFNLNTQLEPISVGLSTASSIGLSCGGPPITFGPSTENLGEFNVNDDSSFTFYIVEDSGGCGFGAASFEFTATKL